MSGPSYLHVHQSDDEAWHVLEGRLRFRFADREIDATPGTTVFVPAGVAHAYRTVEPSRYLMITTLKIDRLIEKLLHPSGVADLPSLLGRFDTVLAEQSGVARPCSRSIAVGSGAHRTACFECEIAQFAAAAASAADPQRGS